jgi:flagellar biosynthesis protein FliQ
MADTVQQPVKYEDVMQLRSRISWGAIFGGMVVALSAYLILTLLFMGIGVSLNENAIRTNAFGIAAVVAAVVTVVAAMFLGGWVTTQLTAGETQREAVIHGVLCWAAFTGSILCMAASTARTGYAALVSGAVVVQNAPAQNVEPALRNARLSQEQVDQVRAYLNDPRNQEMGKETAMAVVWGALIGTLLSMGSAIGGALAGCGPSFRLFPVAHHERREIIIAR